MIVSKEEILKSVGIPILISAILSIANVIYTSEQQKVLLEENRDAVVKLTETVTQLRIENAATRGMFITREELRAELASRSKSNGS